MAISSISGNSSASAAQANISRASSNAASSISRLSSGNKIVKASDDVAGLSVGTSLRTQVTSLKAALGNASQGTSLLQVADGALSQIVDILQRQKAIASQASSGQLTDTDRGYLNQEFQGLKAQIDAIATGTNFNGVTLLNGGLGTTTTLINTNAQAVLAGAAATATATGQTAAAGAGVVSTTAIEAFNASTGATLKGTAAAGTLDITDSSGTVLAGSQYLNVSNAVYGSFSNFKLSNVIYGASATLTATLNGVDYTGSVTSGTTNVLLSNGNTYIKIGTSAAAVTLTNAGTVATAQAQFGQDFKNTQIARVTSITGVDFAGTRLAGAVGTAANGGNATARLYSTNATISNFRYAGNGGAADTNKLEVDINGQTFQAQTVKDAIATGAGKIVFASSDNQYFYLDLAGLTDPFTATLNIRTSTTERANFINALNQGFSKAGSGLSFSVGSKATDTIGVNLSSASSASLYNGASLDVASATSAAAASSAIDTALKTATALRASVGALQSRFNYASANLDTSIQNQDAARGTLLDTDVSTESTAYSTAQVQLQAGIAVLAQANQLPQNLLKLIQ